MPGQARKFTDEERTALVRAVLVDGMTQLAAIRAAKAGELIPEHPFTIARGTLQGYLRRAAGDPKDGVTTDQIRAQLLSALKREIDAELPKLTGEKKLSFIRQALGAVAGAEKQLQARAAKTDKGEKPSEQELESESLERLRALVGEDGPAPTDIPPQDNGKGTAQPQVAHAEKTQEKNQIAEGGPAIAGAAQPMVARARL